MPFYKAREDCLPNPHTHLYAIIAIKKVMRKTKPEATFIRITDRRKDLPLGVGGGFAGALETGFLALLHTCIAGQEASLA